VYQIWRPLQQQQGGPARTIGGDRRYVVGMRTVDHVTSGSVSGNALGPEQMTPAERLGEIADILALGLIRLQARKSSPIVADGGESSLDLSATESGHAPKGKGE